MTELSKKLQAELVELVKRFQLTDRGPYFFENMESDALSICKRLPDPDLEAAENLTDRVFHGGDRKHVFQGPEDYYAALDLAKKSALAGIRHGKGATA